MERYEQLLKLHIDDSCAMCVHIVSMGLQKKNMLITHGTFTCFIFHITTFLQYHKIFAFACENPPTLMSSLVSYVSNHVFNLEHTIIDT